MIKKCIICGNEFETLPNGKSRKYCYDCSPSYEKNNNKSRGTAITIIRRAIKKQLVLYKGGKCEKCGYDKSLNALQFHHINPEIKDFDLSVQYNGGHLDMELLYKEVDKCKLLCSNCHAEEHDIWLLS